MAMLMRANLARMNIVIATIGPAFAHYLRHIISLAKWSLLTKMEYANFEPNISEKYTTGILTDAVNEANGKISFVIWNMFG